MNPESTTKSTTVLTKNSTNNAKSNSMTNSTTASIIELANMSNNATIDSDKDDNFKSKHKELIKVNKELKLKLN